MKHLFTTIFFIAFISLPDVNASAYDYTRHTSYIDRNNPFTLQPAYTTWIYNDQSPISYFKEQANKKTYEAGHWALTLGAMYYEGHRVPKNYQLAAEYFKKASELKTENSFYNMGLLLLNGYFVKKNEQLAANSFYVDASRGLPYAQHALGLLLLYTRDENNYVEAYKWLNLSAAVLDEAKIARKELESKMTKEQIINAQDAAAKWKPRAIK